MLGCDRKQTEEDGSSRFFLGGKWAANAARLDDGGCPVVVATSPWDPGRGTTGVYWFSALGKIMLSSVSTADCSMEGRTWVYVFSVMLTSEWPSSFWTVFAPVPDKTPAKEDLPQKKKSTGKASVSCKDTPKAKPQ